jgi:Peptidase M15
MRNRSPRPVNHTALAGSLDRVETAARALSAVLLLGSVVGGGALFLRAAPAQAQRETVQAPMAPQPKPTKYAKPNAVAANISTPRRVWVDPPLPAAEQTASATASVQPVPEAAAVTRAAFVGLPSAPTECLPAGLRNVLKDVETRFGSVMLVSTTELHTDNHSRGSVRHKLHGVCEAVDFKVTGNRQTVVAYLRSRPEVGGVNSYGNNGVIHIDHAGPRQVAQR